MTDVCTQGPYSVQDSGAGVPEYLLCRMAKESFCCMVPETDFACLTDGENRVRCIFEKGEQFRFQHVHILERLTETRRNNRGKSSSCPEQCEALPNLLGINLGLVRQGQVTFQN